MTGAPKTLRFDSDFAKTLIGKRLLVGVTYVSQETGELLEQVQFHGPVEVADERGIAIRRGVDDLFWMPPDTSGLRPAAPGVYTLRSTGEEVEDPDFLATWTVTRPRTPPPKADAHSEKSR